MFFCIIYGLSDLTHLFFVSELGTTIQNKFGYNFVGPFDNICPERFDITLAAKNPDRNRETVKKRNGIFL